MEWIPKVEEKKHFCHQCKNELVFEVKLQRKDTCPHCSVDMHVCKNCEHWDAAAHNQCKERIAEHISDRERSNFCSFFVFRNGRPEDTSGRQKQARAALEDLFAKKK